MKQIAVSALICFSALILPGYVAGGELPVIEGEAVVATVNEEPITLAELNNAIAASHARRAGKDKAGAIDYSNIMNRLINTKLILFEAKNIGLHELPEVKEAVEKYSKEALIKLLLQEQVVDIEPAEEEVENIYKEKVRQWKIKSVIFDKQEDAERIAEKIKAGNDFDKTVEWAVAEGIANGMDEGYLQDKDLKPAIARLVANMKMGSVSPVVSLGESGFMLFRLQDTRFPQDRNPETWEKAKREARRQKKAEAAKDYYNDLKNRYVRVNDELFEALDYESGEEGFEKLLEDTRVLAKIEGEEPITVEKFSRALKEKFYHGVELAVNTKRVNVKKHEVLQDILQKQVLLKEAKEISLDETDKYLNRVKQYTNSVIFGTFVNKVIAPDIKLHTKELTSYYQKNKDEYSYPEMVRIKSLVFLQRNDAVSALDKLKRGTNFNWLSANANGQASEGSEDLLRFEGRLLVLDSLPEEVQQALSGAGQGDYRLYESPAGHFYVLYLYDLIPAKPQPFDSVKKEIAEKVYNTKVKKAVEVYADRLREYYPVKIYAEDLR